MRNSSGPVYQRFSFVTISLVVRDGFYEAFEVMTLEIEH